MLYRGQFPRVARFLSRRWSRESVQDGAYVSFSPENDYSYLYLPYASNAVRTEVSNEYV